MYSILRMHLLHNMAKRATRTLRSKFLRNLFFFEEQKYLWVNLRTLNYLRCNVIIVEMKKKNRKQKEKKKTLATRASCRDRGSLYLKLVYLFIYLLRS